MAKRFLVGIILGALVAHTPAWAATAGNSPALIATPPQPAWSDLTLRQKIVLAPLSDDWDSLEYFRQKKWLAIAARFSSMSPEEQRRVQRQMQEWGKLTPLQRQIARENFKTTSQLSSEKKLELKQKWEAYSNLPEEEKAKFKEKAAKAPTPRSKKPTAAPPPSSGAQPLPTPSSPAPSQTTSD